MIAQGIVLLIIGGFLLARMEQELTASRYIIAALAFLAGAIAIIGYFTSYSSEKDRVELVSGMFSSIAGVFFLAGGQLALDLISWLFFILMLINAFLILRTCWFYKSEISWWWVSILLLVFTLYLIFQTGQVNSTLKLQQSVLPGIQFLVSGILVLILAMIIRKLELDYSKTLQEIIDKKKVIKP